MIIDKQQVARHFSKAAESYNDYAELQRNIGHQLLSYLPRKDYPLALDLGCGTGYFAAALQGQADKVVALDLSLAMAAKAKQSAKPFAAMVSDAEQLALVDSSVDMVYSSLALQWCNDLGSALKEIKRVLKPNGILLFSTLSKGTLFELEEAWADVDKHRHVNRFLTQDEIKQAADSSGFASAEFYQEQRTLWYEHAFLLLADLKGIGANYVVGGEPNATNRSQLKTMAKNYKAKYSSAEQNNRISATYKVSYGVLNNG
ncbi:malonyl-ACP O-methyltransferase BioC [Agarivorans aestuarii]|uniref:Malonyl-[acyl-carrier protein] O-methyltransferase n=1 Tax=Agarivorans aestuarii TaxID=1563703 RepID=A0ABU7FYX7_9ALTE|nr:malonyl-ACP O-methyltransferase BioC [Agarivorans aestuarii]MEE1672358.1 malonyl-ACP O-methyltransferase BioC [Agarivorans aestuarii]